MVRQWGVRHETVHSNPTSYFRCWWWSQKRLQTLHLSPVGGDCLVGKRSANTKLYNYSLFLVILLTVGGKMGKEAPS